MQELEMTPGVKARITHVVSRILIIALIALVAEVFAFNANHFLSAGNDPIDLTSQLEGQLPQDDDGSYLFTVAAKTVVLDGLNKEVGNIVVDLSPNQPAQAVPVRISFTDSAHATYFEDNDYAAGVPEVIVTTNLPRSHYISLQTSGITDSIRLQLAGEGTVYPVKIDAVYLNGVYPFEFNGLRYSVFAGLLLLVYALRPRSSIYKRQILERRPQSKALVMAIVCVELALLSSFMFYSSNQVGVATSGYNHGQWDGHSIVNTFEVGGDNAQQYAELARSFANGQLYLEEEPPAWLVQMEDPYDKGARDEMIKRTGETILWDTAYHDGHYYVYFGVVPCLLFYLPFYLVTGHAFPTAIGVLLAVVAFVIGLTMLIWRFATRHFRRVSQGVFLLLQMPLIFCSGVLYLLKFPTFYSLPIACGLAFSVWGLFCWMVGRSSKTPCRWYIAGSLCMALVLGCRPQLVVLSLVAFPLFWRRYITQGRIRTSAGIRELACLLAPYALVFGGIMWYNAARFGSPFDFGANYNLTMNDMTQRGFNIGRLAPALFAYLIQPPNVTGVFPFLQPVDFATSYAGQTIREVTFGGIFACLPILWAIFFARPVLKMRIQSRKTHTVSGAVVLMLVLGVLLCCLDGEAAGVLQRYYADFTFLFLAAAVLVVFIANESLDAWSHEWLLMQRALVVLVGLSLLYSGLMCLVPETGWISSAYPWAYQSLIQAFQFWT
ncbi:MAG: cytochrome C oxidase Cbb3 [Coriobacteriia bacterium]|nr:cytochrome C oxidase Cbb3 [Coriobacteriia bacterium]